ncbi:MAG TPA: hypothetical protein VLA14_00660 [Polyangia bacterium]|jgi:hypothetical protein|nr:hypothetical protein [Polyangia bacterium]
MEDSRVRTVSARRALVAAATALALVGGCAGRYARPRTLASLGTVAVLGGSATWAAGQELGHGDSALVTAGFVTVAAGLAAIVVAGGWISVAVRCEADPDCDETEQCREIPAPPGGVPYKQCMRRQ